jgi:peptidoglycan/xylan/chitin deacetylase (PgdA/CDA1 family)
LGVSHASPRELRLGGCLFAIALGAAAAAGAAYASSTLLPWRGVFDRAGASVWRVDADELALTFDDGPDPVRTPLVLDALARTGALATFFVIGSSVARCPRLLRRIVDEGHAVGNHTLDHHSLLWRSETFIEDAILRAQRTIFDACGVTPDAVRAPFGRRDATFYRVAARLHLRPVFWSRDTLDWTGMAAPRIASRLGSSRGGDIVLMHDGAPKATGTVEALAVGLERLSKRGRTPRRLLSADRAEAVGC